MNRTLIQTVAALGFAVATPLLAQAQTIEHLPRVVITGKAQAAAQHIVQLPRVVVEGRASTLMALNSATQPDTRRI